MSIFDRDSPLLNVARRASRATGCPVLGGVTVFLHGYRRTTFDVDLFTIDVPAAKAALLALGATWNHARREFDLDGVPILLVTLAQTETPPDRTSETSGVLVVSLADLIRIQLSSGLRYVHRAQDIADVVSLIRDVPLDKCFAAKLPPALRPDFNKLVGAVRSASRRN